MAVPIDEVRQLLTALLVRKSLFEFDARTVVDRMLEADLLGDHAAGAASIVTFLERMDQGEIDPRARILTETETSAMGVLDGSSAMGHVAATHGMKLAIDKARNVGTGTIVVHHSHHFGAAVLYSNMAAANGMIGLVTSNIGPATRALQDSEQPGVAEHPLVMSVPHGEDCLSIDLSAPTSPLELSLTASILAGLLSGGRLPIVKPTTATTNGEHFFLAIDIGTFTDAGRFGKKLIDSFSAIAAGSPEVAQPDSMRQVRVLPRSLLGADTVNEQGGAVSQTVPLNEGAMQAIAAVASRLKIEVPWHQR